MDNTAPNRQWVACPGCSEAFDPDTESPAASRGDAGGAVQCPFCSTRFVPGPASRLAAAPEAIPSPAPPMSAQSDDSNEPFIIDDDDTPDDDPAAIRAQAYRTARAARDISTDRVRDLSKYRRALLRIRTWCVVTAVACAVAIVKATLVLVVLLRNFNPGWKSYLYLGLLAVMLPAAAFGAFHFARRARAVSNELRKPVLDEPTAPPDFSTLSDGSQQWKKLEEM